MAKTKSHPVGGKCTVHISAVWPGLPSSRVHPDMLHEQLMCAMVCWPHHPMLCIACSSGNHGQSQQVQQLHTCVLCLRLCFDCTWVACLLYLAALKVYGVISSSMQKSPANTSGFFHSNNAMPAKSITGPLQNKAASMQAANVHAILESGPFVQRVQVRLNDSIALIDDLDETLAIFDLKLRHMREDIAAIESRNNRCISQSCPRSSFKQTCAVYLINHQAIHKHMQGVDKHLLSCWSPIKQ